MIELRPQRHPQPAVSSRPSSGSAIRALSSLASVAVATTLAAPRLALAQHGNDLFQPGNLVVSRSLYIENPALGLYPFAWNNDLTDGSFGITSKILLDQMTPSGSVINSVEVPNSTQNGVPPTKDQMVTSFSSKSELALNLSTDGSMITFMGYFAPVNAIDVSNSNTPAVVDPTNPVTGTASRVVAAYPVRRRRRRRNVCRRGSHPCWLAEVDLRRRDTVVDARLRATGRPRPRSDVWIPG